MGQCILEHGVQFIRGNRFALFDRRRAQPIRCIGLLSIRFGSSCSIQQNSGMKKKEKRKQSEKQEETKRILAFC